MHRATFLPRTRRDQRGSTTAIEVIGLIPIMALVVGAIFQIYLVAQAGVEATAAARLTARELSKGTAATTAASQGRAQANPRFAVRVTAAPAFGPGARVSATAQATVPFLGIGVPGLDLTVTRSAAMPGPDSVLGSAS